LDRDDQRRLGDIYTSWKPAYGSREEDLRVFIRDMKKKHGA
jgi:hypothetical protein